MARPKKESVDYFPHYCEHGKTVFILENNFGNDGYAFFYKLLERLGKAKGHYIDCRKLETWEFLQAKTNVSEVMARSILDKLSDLEVIDPKLWSISVIWMQTFTDSIGDVYKNRRADIPAKPSFYNPKPQHAVVSTSDIPQSKVKESKVNKTKAKKRKKPIPPDFKISDRVKIWAEGKEYNKLEEHLEAFKLSCSAKGYEYIDWDAAFMKAITDDWARIRNGGNYGQGATRGTGAAIGKAQSDNEPYPVDGTFGSDA